MHFYVIYVMIWLATKLLHQGLPPPNPCNTLFSKIDRQKKSIQNRTLPSHLHKSMRRRQRLNGTVQKYAPNWYAILKSANDLELAHDVGPTHDVSLTYIYIFLKTVICDQGNTNILAVKHCSCPDMKNCHYDKLFLWSQ